MGHELAQVIRVVGGDVLQIPGTGIESKAPERIDITEANATFGPEDPALERFGQQLVGTIRTFRRGTRFGHEPRRYLRSHCEFPGFSCPSGVIPDVIAKTN